MIIALRIFLHTVRTTFYNPISEVIDPLALVWVQIVSSDMKGSLFI